MKSMIALVQGLKLNVQTLEGSLFLILWFVICEAPRQNFEHNQFSKRMLNLFKYKLSVETDFSS